MDGILHKVVSIVGGVVSAYFQVRLCLLVSGKVGYIKLSQCHGLNSPCFS